MLSSEGGDKVQEQIQPQRDGLRIVKSNITLKRQFPHDSCKSSNVILTNRPKVIIGLETAEHRQDLHSSPTLPKEIIELETDSIENFT